MATQICLSGSGKKQEYGSIGLPYRQVYLGLNESRNLAPPDSHMAGPGFDREQKYVSTR